MTTFILVPPFNNSRGLSGRSSGRVTAAHPHLSRDTPCHCLNFD